MDGRAGQHHMDVGLRGAERAEEDLLIKAKILFAFRSVHETILL
jgi:hypothetical protein